MPAGRTATAIPHARADTTAGSALGVAISKAIVPSITHSNDTNSDSVMIDA